MGIEDFVKNLSSSLIFYSCFFLKLNQPSCLIPLIRAVTKAPRKNAPNPVKIAKDVKGLTPETAAF